MRGKKSGLFLMAVCCLALGGCKMMEDWRRQMAGGGVESLDPAPQMKVVQVAGGSWLEPVENAQPVERLVPADPRQKKAIERLDQLEKDVAVIRTDMNKSAVPADMAAGSTQIVTKTEIVQEKLAAPSKAVTGTTAAVHKIRFGDQAGKTRIVFDLNHEAPFTYTLDLAGKVLSVNFKNTVWSAAADGGKQNASLVQSYKAIPDGQGGVAVTMLLQKPGRVVWAQALPATDKDSARIVIDLLPL